MERLWPLVDDVEALDPPVFGLAAVWATIARGWAALEVPLNLITLASLAGYALWS